MYWVLPHYFVHNVWTNFHSTPKQISLWPTFLKRRLRCQDQTYFEFVNSHSSLAYELYFAQPNTFIRGSMPEALRFDSNTASLINPEIRFSKDYVLRVYKPTLKKYKTSSKEFVSKLSLLRDVSDFKDEKRRKWLVIFSKKLYWVYRPFWNTRDRRRLALKT